MSILQAIILGIVQGIAEFLPISSSGHLVILQKIFNISHKSVIFDVVLHVGTLLPVLFVFRADILNLIKNPFQKKTYLLIVATVPAVIVGLLFDDYIESLFYTGYFLPIGFFITGLLLLYSQAVSVDRKNDSDISYGNALFIGILQALAILPAVSRSGSTISASLHQGLSREAAASFSFLISIPVIVGAFIFQLIKILFSPDAIVFNDISITPMIFGFIASVLAG